jgi:hypothetical protein
MHSLSDQTIFMFMTLSGIPMERSLRWRRIREAGFIPEVEMMLGSLTGLGIDWSPSGDEVGVVSGEFGAITYPDLQIV